MHSSHLVTGLAGWEQAVTWGEVMASIHVQKHLAALYKDVSLPMPWDVRAPVVSPDERAELEAMLLRGSAIRD